MHFIPPVGLTDAQTPRRKQAVFRPKPMVVHVARAWGFKLPLTLVVQFDSNKRVRSFEAR